MEDFVRLYLPELFQVISQETDDQIPKDIVDGILEMADEYGMEINLVPVRNRGRSKARSKMVFYTIKSPNRT
ncbi:hypothetical protein [Wolbachia endosymbiont of Ctenocephalides felis wCfeT]|uniref:hypothetical protein n=1 Tax=Wolbachia endosymbiont of Ctenocephalides felis wCfeT TaxID=2732593 RepID=UPI001446D7AA|nr:hypothetical protein [Wolbachia endosymbiont of Ctenocephalides felis wCfeT]